MGFLKKIFLGSVTGILSWDCSVLTTPLWLLNKRDWCTVTLMPKVIAGLLDCLYNHLNAKGHKNDVNKKTGSGKGNLGGKDQGD